MLALLFVSVAVLLCVEGSRGSSELRLKSNSSSRQKQGVWNTRITSDDTRNSRYSAESLNARLKMRSARLSMKTDLRPYYFLHLGAEGEGNLYIDGKVQKSVSALMRKHFAGKSLGGLMKALDCLIDPSCKSLHTYVYSKYNDGQLEVVGVDRMYSVYRKNIESNGGELEVVKFHALFPRGGALDIKKINDSSFETITAAITRSGCDIRYDLRNTMKQFDVITAKLAFNGLGKADMSCEEQVAMHNRLGAAQVQLPVATIPENKQGSFGALCKRRSERIASQTRHGVLFPIMDLAMPFGRKGEWIMMNNNGHRSIIIKDFVKAFSRKGREYENKQLAGKPGYGAYLGYCMTQYDNIDRAVRSLNGSPDNVRHTFVYDSRVDFVVIVNGFSRLLNIGGLAHAILPSGDIVHKKNFDSFISIVNKIKSDGKTIDKNEEVYSLTTSVDWEKVGNEYNEECSPETKWSRALESFDARAPVGASSSRA